MNELKRKLSEATKTLIYELMDMIKEGEAKNGLDITDFVKSQAEHNDKINNLLIDFEERNKKKKGLF